jgi:TolB protein
MDADGSHVTNITKTPATSEGWPSWSPDGKTIAYSVDGVIILANPDGSNPHALHSPDPRFHEEAAAWSPDGSMIAYSAFDNARPIFATDTYAIFTAKTDGTDVHRLTALASSARYPSWSPDSKQIVFNRDNVDETWGRFNTQNVWMMNADGSGQVALTKDNNKRNELGGPNAWAK